MNWKLIGLLSLLGAAMGVVVVLGLAQQNERMIWITIAVVMGLILAQAHVDKPFVHGLVTGVFAGVVGMIIEAAFFSTYLAHNPASASEFQQFSMEPSVLLLISAPIIGGVYGLLVGFMTWLASSLVFKPHG